MALLRQNNNPSLFCIRYVQIAFIVNVQAIRLLKLIRLAVIVKFTDNPLYVPMAIQVDNSVVSAVNDIELLIGRNKHVGWLQQAANA
ncbi:hypothetical protein D3C80_1542640 [compost metagenome]